MSDYSQYNSNTLLVLLIGSLGVHDLLQHVVVYTRYGNVIHLWEGVSAAWQPQHCLT